MRLGDIITSSIHYHMCRQPSGTLQSRQMNKERPTECTSLAAVLPSAPTGFKMEQDSGRFKATFEYQAPCFLKYVECCF